MHSICSLIIRISLLTVLFLIISTDFFLMSLSHYINSFHFVLCNVDRLIPLEHLKTTRKNPREMLKVGPDLQN